MRTLEEYVDMIPTAPPDDIERYLDAMGRKPLAVTSYRCISRDDAESRLDCEDCRADLRPSATIRPAALWCSECESWYLAEYVPAQGTPCCRENMIYQNNSGVQVVNVEQDTIDKKRNGETMVCPLCGAQTRLRNVQELRYGLVSQDFAVVPTVTENCLILTQAIGEEGITVEYDNGGGQSGVRENPAFRAYEALWKTYMSGLDMLIKLLPVEVPQEQISDIKPTSVLTLVQNRRKQDA